MGNGADRPRIGGSDLHYRWTPVWLPLIKRTVNATSSDKEMRCSPDGLSKTRERMKRSAECNETDVIFRIDTNGDCKCAQKSMRKRLKEIKNSDMFEEDSENNFGS